MAEAAEAAACCTSLARISRTRMVKFETRLVSLGDKATELANEAYKTGKGLLEIIREKKILTEAQIKDLLDPVKLSNLDTSKYPQ